MYMKRKKKSEGEIERARSSDDAKGHVPSIKRTEKCIVSDGIFLLLLNRSKCCLRFWAVSERSRAHWCYTFAKDFIAALTVSIMHTG